MVQDYLTQLKNAKESSRELRSASTKQKNSFLEKLAGFLIENSQEILEVNQKDLSEAGDITKAMRKRLTLTEDILKGMAQGLKEIAKSDDPVGKQVSSKKAPNGMEVAKVRVPIGVIVFVYESRPNVIIDAAGLCVKSGNVLLSRGGKEAIHSNTILLKYIQKALEEAGLPTNCVQQLEDRSYETFSQVLKEDKYIDLVVPRGREKLIKTVKDNARVPVIAHERGLCHMYVDEFANIEKAIKLVVNAKTSNPSTCNTIETVLIHEKVLEKIIPELTEKLISKDVEVRGDKKVCEFCKKCKIATKEDWDTEYLDLILSIKTVDNFKEALDHIEKHSSGLTDSIITENKDRAEEFLNNINSATVLVNASNRLVDGSVFGLGAELGISTSSIHMRGPMGLEDLTVTKFVVRGNGNIRE